MSYESHGFVMPDYMKAKLDAWAQHGEHPCGDFLTYVLENNFKKAVTHADSHNLQCLPVYAFYMYNQMPAGSHGSPEKVAEWRKKFQKGGEFYGIKLERV